MDYKLPDVYPKLNPIERILIWLAGAEESCLKKCPKWEKRKYEAFGASVLVPVSFGMIGSSYAVSTLTDNLLFIIGFAVIWGLIILTIDRVLLATYRAFTTASKKATQFVLRIVVAVLMGLTVSHPLTLLLFKDTINSEIARGRTEEMKAIRVEAEVEKKGIEKRISEASANLARLQKKYEETIAGEFATGASVSADSNPQGNQSDNRFEDLDSQLSELKNERDEIRAGLEKWQQTYDEEVSGTRGGTAGVGPRARAIESDHLIWRREEMKRLNESISGLSASRVQISAGLLEKNAEANAAIEARRRDLEKQKLDLFASQQGQMVDVIKDQISSSSSELDRLRGDARQLSVDTSDRLNGLKTERRSDMMTQTMVLHHIFENPENGGHFALMVYIIIATLFTLIDTLPLVVKFFSVPGPYDMVQHIEGTKYTPFHNLKIEEDTEKFAEQDIAFRRQMQARIDMFRDVDKYWGNNIPVLPNDGVDENPADITTLIRDVASRDETVAGKPIEPIVDDQEPAGLGSFIKATQEKQILQSSDTQRVAVDKKALPTKTVNAAPVIAKRFEPKPDILPMPAQKAKKVDTPIPAKTRETIQRQPEDQSVQAGKPALKRRRVAARRSPQPGNRAGGLSTDKNDVALPS